MEIKYQKSVYMQINLFTLYFMLVQRRLKRNSRSVKTLRIPVDSNNGIVNSQVTKNLIADNTPFFSLAVWYRLSTQNSHH